MAEAITERPEGQLDAQPETNAPPVTTQTGGVPETPGRPVLDTLPMPDYSGGMIVPAGTTPGTQPNDIASHGQPIDGGDPTLVAAGQPRLKNDDPRAAVSSMHQNILAPVKRAAAHGQVWLTLADGTQVRLVDGVQVRNQHNAEFIGGGHHLVYRYVPEGEVWIDTEVPESDRPFILFHELFERALMRKGHSYDAAHDAANRLENELRRAKQGDISRSCDDLNQQWYADLDDERLYPKTAATIDDFIAPGKRLRPRSEVVCFNDRGIVAIKKSTYLLCPGGGIDEGETAEQAVIREAIEEADRKLLDLAPMGVVRAIWPDDNKLVDGFDGERSHFFLARDGGELGTEHDDNEPFRTIPFDEAESFLQRLLDDETQAWARAANRKRMQCLVTARQRAEEGRAAEEKLATVVEDVFTRSLCTLHLALAKVAGRTSGPSGGDEQNTTRANGGQTGLTAAVKAAAAMSMTELFRADGMFGPVVVRDHTITQHGGVSRELLIGSEVQGGCVCDQSGRPTAVSDSPYTNGWLLAGSQHPTGTALMIGLGSGAGAVALLDNFEGLKLTVVEVDPVVTSAALHFYPRLLELHQQGRLELVIEDVKQFLAGDETGRWDFAICDAYTGELALAMNEQQLAAVAAVADDLWLNVIDRFDGDSLTGVLLALGRAGRPATWVFDAHPHHQAWDKRNLIVTTCRFDPQKAEQLQPYRKAGPEAEKARDDYRAMLQSGYDLSLPIQ